MRRLLLGLIAIACFVAAGGAYLWGVDPFLSSSLFKLGFIFGALWLAFPKLVEVSSRFSPMAVVFAIGGVIVIVFWPRTVFFIGPLLAVLGGVYLLGWLMRPADRKKK